MIYILSLLLISIFFIVLLNTQRVHLIFKYKLKPNCLLTKHSFVFIDGHSSPFYLGKYWNFIPQLLEEHGYEVLTIKQKYLKSFLELSQPTSLKYHLVIDKTQLHLEPLLDEFSDKIASITLNKDEKASLPASFASNYQWNYLNLKASVINQPWSWKILMYFHRLLSPSKKNLNLSYIGHPQMCDINHTAQEYLNLAVRLAENDMA